MDYIIDLITREHEVIIPVVLLILSEAIAASKIESNSITQVIIKALKAFLTKK